jgi:transposase
MAEDTREKEIAHREEAKRKSVDEYYARSEAAKPTPTPEEADRAKLGLPIDEPQHDGSEPEEVVQRRVLESRLPGGNPYDTRAVTAGEAEQPRRGPGRPPSRKPEGE